MRPLKIYWMKNETGQIYVPVHWQETVEIILVQDGSLSLNIGETTYIGAPGDVILHKPT